MKTNFYRFMGIGMLFLFCLQGFSQDNIRFGAAPNNPIVAMPNAYWDVLRTTSTGWTRQYWETATQSWENVEKTVNEKDADGLFTEVSTLSWEASTSTWQNSYKNLYTYQKNTAGQITNASWSKETPSYNGAVQFENTYTQGRLAEMLVKFKNGGNFVPATQAYFKYDVAGNRILDSGISIQQNTVNLMSHYQYDNNKRCVKNVYITLTQSNVLDTTYYYTYSYDANGNMTAFSYYYRLSNGSRLTENVVYNYTYTPNNAIDEMTIYYWDNTTNSIEPEYKYKHYYNNQNKLIAMVNKEYDANGVWFNSDSIAINYIPNGAYDTALMYAGANNTSWENQHGQRLIFSNTSTGINSPNTVETTLKAHPNPTTNSLFVELNAPIDGNTDLVLTDLSGRVLKTKAVSFFAGQNTTTELQIDELATGIYMLRAGNNTIKVIKQ